MVYSSMANRLEQPLAELVEKLPVLDDLFEEDSVLECIDDSTFTGPNLMPMITPYGELKTEHDQEPPEDIVHGCSLPEYLSEVDSSFDYGDCSSVILLQSNFARETHNQVEADSPQMPPVDFVSNTTMLDDVFEEDAALGKINYPTFTSSQPIPCPTKVYSDVDEAYFSYSSTWDGSSWLASDGTTYVGIISLPPTMARHSNEK